MTTTDLSETTPTADRGDAGSLGLFMAITSMVVVTFFGVIVDFSQKLQARHDANIAAEEAARAGAGQIDRARAYTRGAFVIDRQAAIQAAAHYLHSAGYAGSVTAVGARQLRVRVRISRLAIFLPMIGISRLQVEAVAVADLATGVTKEDR